MKSIVVIPARYASTRFIGKVLADIKGKPMIQWVYERSLRAGSVDGVMVATDSEKVAQAVRGFGGDVVMTSREHPTGTDRIAEVAKALDADIIVNVQGDEPLIEPEQIDLVSEALKTDLSADMGTIAAKIEDSSDLDDPDVVKVTLDKNGYALYFSRLPIPFNRDGLKECPRYRHIGLYSYRKDFLSRFTRLPQTPLETAERLEQLRALENGYKIKVLITKQRGIGVDTPQDLKRLIQRLG